MYLTGGIGSSGHLERFTVDYDLPNEYNYSESCASIGLAMFGMRMNQITKDLAMRTLWSGHFIIRSWPGIAAGWEELFLC